MSTAKQPLPVRVGVIDAGLGNVNSVINMFERTPALSADLCADPDKGRDFDLLVLPGVGSFDHGVQRLHSTGWYQSLTGTGLEDAWIMGICLGMQLLCESSDEGSLGGLGLIPGHFERLPSTRFGEALKVPHMGWNQVCVGSASTVLASGIGPGNRFYFVHSYHYVPVDGSCVVATSDYGGPVVAGIQQGQVFGVQFHPEKSHRSGQQLLTGIVNHIAGYEHE